MRLRFSSDAKRGLRSERGSVAVEFAIIFPILVLLVFGIIDFGHAWYMKHMMSDASREGARYATRYKTDATGHRILPKDLSPNLSTYVLTTWGLTDRLPADASPTVTPSGTAATEANASVLAGEDYIVTITATKTWFVLGNLIPSLGTSKTLTVTTTMTCE
jgi:Flp pilus assembly protein TadG